MRSKDLQQLILSKYKNGDDPIRRLYSAIDLRIIERECKIIRKAGSIDLLKPSGRPRVTCSKETNQKIRNRLKHNKQVSSQKLAKAFDISERSVRRILKSDLGVLDHTRSELNQYLLKPIKSKELYLLIGHVKYFSKRANK